MATKTQHSTTSSSSSSSSSLPPQFATSHTSPQLQLNHLIDSHIISSTSTSMSMSMSMPMSSTYPYAPPINDPAPLHRSRPNILKRLTNRLQLAYYRYEVTYGIYVMTPEEKFVANTFLLVFISLLVWGLFLYFPPLLFQKVGRLAWLLTGAGMDGVKERRGFSAELRMVNGTAGVGSGSDALPGPHPGPGDTGVTISMSSTASMPRA
ncbi:hypothetical protein EMCG_06659 [[Emmonsia] crescens]|uniref:Serine palmitoyltransferase n=1 Tax=[Emmonsia] crescens TaxID=73230 RepID=A0A0G2IBE9_9EURO|nr:hypothetical protein EMCG_06659 [Emmonsia crescens UAMH 3008]